jgi:tetratricopeptide (TPR) repeat protein
MAGEWYRKTAWTQEDEKEFFAKLKRARSWTKPQYLLLQAGTLIGTNDSKLFDVALMLVDKYFTECQDEPFDNKFIAFEILGDIYRKMENYETALEKYKKAIEVKSLPGRTMAPIYYSELVICLNKVELFGEVEELLIRETMDIDFPISKYKINAMLAIINKQKNDLEKARRYKKLAEDAAGATETVFRWHRKSGLVEDRDIILDKLLRKIK